MLLNYPVAKQQFIWRKKKKRYTCVVDVNICVLVLD